MQARLSRVMSILLLLVLTSLACGAEPLATFTVGAAGIERLDTPVSAPLVGLPEMGWRLEEVTGGKRVPVPAQVEAGVTPKLWWVLSGVTKAGASRVFEVVSGTGPKVAGVDVTKNDKFLQIGKGADNILRYHHAIMPPPEGQSPLYERSAFIHPLWSPAGSVLTDIHPPDHYHHMGLWMPWTHTEFEGKPTDFWNLKAGQGTVRFVKYLDIASGPVFGGFQSQHHHVALQTKDGEKIVLNEVWDVRAYNVGGPEKGYWLLDFKSTQRCVADSPLKQVKYRYGGFGYRAARQWKGENAAYLTSEGKTRKDGHATRARWCDASGKIDEWEGVTFYSHPDNFQHPEPMRIWPGFDDNVFFNFCPSQATDWEMKPGEDHVFRYRMVVHQGKVDVDEAERHWRDYAEPPVVKAVFNRPDNAVTLFDGTDFSQWQREGGGEIKWELADGVMQIVPDSGSLITKKPVKDFLLHVEFKTPQLPDNVKGQGRGNSGVYIQQRYEVQILDSYGLKPKNNECAGIYKFKAPDRNVCKKAGQWQTYDIAFRAARFKGDKKTEDARITVYHNGVLVHDDVQIPNKTGAGHKEGPEPKPIRLQDHSNAVSFRNIWIVPLD